MRLYLTKEITNFIPPNLLPKIRNMVLKKGGVSKTALMNYIIKIISFGQNKLASSVDAIAVSKI